MEATGCRFEYPQFVDESLGILFEHFGLALKRRSEMEEEKKPSRLPWSPRNIAALEASDPELCKLVEGVFEAAKELLLNSVPDTKILCIARVWQSS